MALTGAVSGYVAFDADSTFDGNTTYYALEDADGTKWEVGLGTLSADSTTLTRTTILATQASFTDTTRQTFSSGTHTIYCVYPAGKSVHLDASGVLSHSIVNADISNSAAIAIAKLASSSIGVSDGSSTTEISLGEDIQFRGTSNEVEVEEASGTITIGLPSSITADLTGDVTGNADTATTATNVTVADESTDATCFPLFVTAATGNLAPKSGDNLTFNSNTGVLTATGFAGPLTGNVTGNTSGSSGSCTGNSATATLASTVTVTDSTADTAFPVVFHDESNALLDDTTAFTYNPNSGTLVATAFSGPLTGNVTGNASGSSGSCTGNSATATLASTVTVTDSTSNTDFPIVFHDESNALLDDTGAFEYNPSTGTITLTGAVIDFNGSTGNNKLELTDNLASALDITEASNSYMKFTTTDNASRIVTNVGVVGNTTALTSQSGSVVINAALGNYFTVATSGNITGLDIQNAVVGQKILIRFAWGGDHSLSFTDTVAFPGNTPPGTTASGVDVIGFICTTASSAFDGFIVGEDLRSS